MEFYNKKKDIRCLKIMLFVFCILSQFLIAETDEEIKRRLEAEQAAYEEYIVYVNQIIRQKFVLQMAEELGLDWLVLRIKCMVR